MFKRIKKIETSLQIVSNLDLYLLFCFVVMHWIYQLLGAKEIWGISAEQWVNSLTVTLLGLLAVSMIRRRILEKNDVAKRAGFDTYFLESFPADFNHKFEKYEDVRVAAVSLSQLGSDDELRRILRKKLMLGHSVQFLLVDPRSKYFKMTADRGLDEVEEDLIKRVEADLAFLKSIQGTDSSKLEVHVTDYPIPYCGIMMKSSARGNKNRIYTAHYPFKTSVVREPKHIFIDGLSDYYYLYEEELNNLWEYSASYEFQGVSSVAYG